jgi:hypothetical protein
MTFSATFTVHACAEPGMLPRLLQPFAKRDETPDHMEARRHGDDLLVELRLEAVCPEVARLILGNLRQVVGVLSAELREASGLAVAA